MDKCITFTIVETSNGVFSIVTKDRYFSDYTDLHFDGVAITNIYGIMKVCSYICNNKYNVGAVFEIA